MTIIDPTSLPREAQAGPIFHPDLGTHAFAAYHANTTGLNALLAFVFGHDHDSAEARDELARRRQVVDEAFSGPWAIDLGYTALSWQVAMRVSAVEVYLQDALTFLAVYDPDFIRGRGSEQTWGYDDFRTASDADAVLWAYCDRWARNFIGDGGPTRWAAALQRAGLGEFADADVAELEAMWGYRHMRVHNGGRFSPEFVRRHPTAAEAIWNDGLQLAQVKAWIEKANAFVRTAERAIAARLRARLGTALIEERERVRFEASMRKLDIRFKDRLKQRFPDRAERIEEAFSNTDHSEWYSLVHELLGLGALSGATGETPARRADLPPD
jgi:hypothetical protein